MREERSITEYARVPMQRVWWSAIFAGTFFAFGVMLILGFFGAAIGAAIATPLDVTTGVTVWAGIWSLVTVFFGFYFGGWMSARLSGSQAKSDGRLHGLVTWGLGTSALFYLAVTSTTRLAGILGAIAPNIGRAAVNPSLVENMTVTAATWTLIAMIVGLIGAVAGGHSGGYKEAASVTTMRRVA